MTYGSEPAYGGPPTPPPSRAPRPAVWGAVLALVAVVLILFGLYSCNGGGPTPPVASPGPVPPTVSGPVTTAPYSAPGSSSSTSTAPDSSAPATAPTPSVSGVPAPSPPVVVPTAVEAGSGGWAGSSASPDPRGPLLLAAGGLLVTLSTAALIRGRRRRP